MLPNELPKIIDPIKLCRQGLGVGTALSGIVCASKLTDNKVYSGTINQISKPITVELNFSYDSNKVHVIEGHISTLLRLNCQRCLEDFDFELLQKIYVGVVPSLEAAKLLPEQYEPLLLEDGKINVLDWLMEEINLAIPMIPMHEASCGLQKHFSDTLKYDEKNKENKEKNNGDKIFPFANLNQKLNKEVE